MIPPLVCAVFAQPSAELTFRIGDFLQIRTRPENIGNYDWLETKIDRKPATLSRALNMKYLNDAVTDFAIDASRAHKTVFLQPWPQLRSYR